MRDDDDAQLKPIERFALVDDGPVARPPDAPAGKRRSRVEWTDFMTPEGGAREELDSPEGSDPDSDPDWYECE